MKHPRILYEDEYQQMLQKQGGVCAICRGIPEPNKRDGRRFVVDHNHLTGKIRGLLCSGCNTLVGFYEGGIRLREKRVKSEAIYWYLLQHDNIPSLKPKRKFRFRPTWAEVCEMAKRNRTRKAEASRAG